MSIAEKLDIENNPWKSCRYKISVEIHFSDKTERVLQPSQITGLYLEKDYDVDHLPVMMLDLAIGNEMAAKIKSDLLTEFHVKILQYYIEEGTNEKKGSRIYLNDVFVAPRLDTTPDSASKMDEKSREKDGFDDDSLSVYDMQSQETYILIRKKDMTFTKKMTNAVLNNVTILDAVAYLLSFTKCKGNVLLSNFTNVKKHEELLLPPKPLLSQLMFLEEEYGWHKEGSYLFLDFGLLYIIRKNAKCTAWRKNEPKKICFCISEVTSSDTVSKGIIKKKDTVYVNIGTDQYELKDGSAVGDQILGANMILTNTTTGKTEKVESGVTTYDNGSYTSKTYHGHNPYIKEQFVRTKLEAENQIVLTCLNGDLTYFTPNKQYTFLTDLTKIAPNFKGSYRMGSIKTSFVKNGDYYDTTSIMIVKRVDKTISL